MLECLIPLLTSGDVIYFTVGNGVYYWADLANYQYGGCGTENGHSFWTDTQGNIPFTMVSNDPNIPDQLNPQKNGKATLP
ncbi:MAG: hypothetical protein AAB386_04685 [Patescibacteria group bacterium]